jgi:hypothetical protein
MKIQAFKNKKEETLCIKKFKISKNHLKMEGDATGSTIFKNGVKNLTPPKTRTL